jgi:RecA/RadA recombinase
MSNIIYDLKIVNQKIREDLKEQFPNLSFSVKKDNQTIYISLLAGNIQPFAPSSEAEKKGYIQVNKNYIDDDQSLSQEGKSAMKGVKEIAQKYNYDNSDPMTDYFDVNFYLRPSIGSYDKPYQYKANSKSSKIPPQAKAPSSESQSSPTGDKLLHEFNGWKMYVRNVKGKEVFVIIKDKSTPSNKESWNDIKSEVYLQTGFKWNPSFQNFSKWSEFKDFNKDINTLNDIFNKYYFGKQEQPAPTPKQPAPEPTMPETPKSETKNTKLKELLKTFKNPSDVNNREERLEILNELETRLDNLFDFFRSDKEGFFKLQNVEGIFLEVKVGDKELNLLDGLKLDFKGEETKRFTLIELLKRITDIGGIANGWTDIIFGVEVTVDGEVESESNRRIANERAKEEKRLFHEEDWLTGGALGIYAWYSFSRTVNAAKNFLNNEFEASFKYAEFTDRIKNEMLQKDVILDGEDYKGNPTKDEAKLYMKLKDEKFVYLLKQGGYTGLYSNSWEVGYRMMKAMIDKKNKVLSYVKDVDPFGASKVGAKEYLPQLIAQAPELFPKSAVETDREVLQGEINGLEQFLKDFPDLSDDETRLILSQILDLHNLLNLI